ncbi:glycosyltransferase family 4 protein [Candidatus Pseudothioglobus singularis]|nr:glycosyltransferase family 4 protein [Candidatus Pseudothioglobus singularis]
MMKVLIIQGGVDTNLVTGEEVVINNDIEYFQKTGVNAIYEQIKIPKSGWQSFFGKIGGLLWSITNYRKVNSAIVKYKPDIVHFHTIVPYLSFSVIAAANNAGIPILQTLHNGRWLCLEGGYFRNNTFCDDCVGSYGWLGLKRGCGHGKLISLPLFLNNFIVRKFGFLARYVTHFIAVSEFVREQHIRSGFPRDKITVRNNGFNFLDLNLLEDSWLFRNGIVFSGRVSIAKGALVLKYLISHCDCPIKIIGNGPELGMLKQYCVDNDFMHVEFFGKVDNTKVIEIISKSILTVVPSQCGDSFPTVALESISVGTPVIASNLGGLPDLIDSSGGGVIVDHANHSQFVVVIKELLKNKERAKLLGDDGKSYALKNVSLDRQGKQLVGIYNKVIAEYKESRK